MDLHEALYTTRAMRRVRPDPIPADAQARILDAAIRAPSGGNQQHWRFLLVDDPEVKARLAPLYLDSVNQLWTTVYARQVAAAAAAPDDPESIAVRQGPEVGPVAGRPLRAGAPVPLRLRPARGVGRLDLPGHLERAARRPAPRGSAAASPRC